jgi:argininosuccinate synthase
VNKATTVHRVVLAYSGSTNTTAAIPWLAERHGAEIVTVTLDLGQRTGLEAIRDRALAAGAVRTHVVDARDEFARDFIVPALRAGAMRPDAEMLDALTWPIIAKHLVDVARMEQADAVAHGADGENASCFESLIRDLEASRVVLAPVRDWTFSATELADYARARRIATGTFGAVTRAITSAPDCPANVEVAFEEGVPVSVNGVELTLVDLISSVETIAGAHGVGRVSPAATVLHEAHRALQSSVVPPDVDQSAQLRGAGYADLVAAGGWYSPARADEDAFVASVQKQVTGTARIKLFQGHSEVVECRSPFARS